MQESGEQNAQGDAGNAAGAGAWRYSSRATQFFVRQPTLLHKIVAAVLLLALLGVIAVLAVFGFLVGAVIAGIALVAWGISYLRARISGKLGATDAGRDNVRVIIRRDVN